MTLSLIYLTKDERALWERLPPGLRAEWKDRIRLEPALPTESPADVQKRLEHAPYKDTDALAELLQNVERQVEQGGEIVYPDIPPASLDTLLEALGITGLTCMVELALQKKDIDATDIEGLAVLSHVRHGLAERKTAPKSKSGKRR